MSFDIAGKHIEYDIPFVNYYLIRKEFETLANKLLPQIIQDFPNKFKDLEDFIDKGRSWAGQYFKESVVLAVDILAAAKCYTLDIQSYFNDYFDTTPFDSHFKNISNKLAEIYEAEEDRDRARAARTHAASNAWSGGGFGVSGALKGAATAGALNMAGGAISGTFNALGKVWSSANNSMKKDDILKSDETKNAIVNGIYLCINCAYYELIPCLRDKARVKIDFIDDQRKKQVERLMSNLRSGRIPEAEQQSILFQALSLNPYNKEIYLSLLDNYGDKDGSIEAMAVVFDVNDITEKKKVLLDEFYKDQSKETEDDCLNLRTIMSDKAEQLGIKGFEKYEPLEKEIRKWFDRYYSTLPRETEQQCYELRPVLRNKARQLGIDNYTQYSKLEKDIKDWDIKERSFGSLLFNKRNEAYDFCEEVANYDSSHMKIIAHNFSFFEDQSLKFANNIDKPKLQDFYNTLPKEYSLAQKQEALCLYEKEILITDKAAYIKEDDKIYELFYCAINSIKISDNGIKVSSRFGNYNIKIKDKANVICKMLFQLFSNIKIIDESLLEFKQADELLKHEEKILQGYETGSLYFVCNDYDGKLLKKINNAIKKYANSVDPKEIAIFIDTTIFGSGDEGLIILRDGSIYYNYRKICKHYIYENKNINFKVKNSSFSINDDEMIPFDYFPQGILAEILRIAQMLTELKNGVPKISASNPFACTFAQNEHTHDFVAPQKRFSFAGISYTSEEEVKKQAELFDMYNAIDTSKPIDTTKKAIEDIREKALQLNVSSEWLQPYFDKLLEFYFVAYQAELKKYFDTLDTSTEEKALQARDLMAQKAKEINAEGYTCYSQLEQIIKKYDDDSRTVDGVLFENREIAEKQQKIFALFKAIDKNSSPKELQKEFDKIVTEAEKLNVSSSWLDEKENKLLHQAQKKYLKQLEEYFATLDISSEEKALAARKLVADKAQELGLLENTTIPKLEKTIEKFDIEFRTVGGNVFESREIASKQKEIYSIFTAINTHKYLEAIQKIQQVHSKAEELGISSEWLNPKFEKLLSKIQSDAQTALDKYYQTLDVSTEEKALEAREYIKTQADQLEIQNFSTYKPLEDLILEYDIKARTFDGKLFDTREDALCARKNDELLSFFKEQKQKIKMLTTIEDKEAKAQALRTIVSEKAKQIGIPLLSTGYQPLEEYIQELEIEARTVSGRIYATREEAIKARKEEKLFNFFEENKREIVKISTVEDREKEAVALRSKVQSMANELALDIGASYNPLEEFINQLDLEFRTIGTKILATRQEAIKIKSHIAYAAEIFKAISGTDVYTIPNIPVAKLNSAINGYKVDINPGEVFFLFDATIFGSADEGIIVTWDSLYCKKDNELAKSIPLNTHHDFSCQKKLLMGYKVLVDGNLIVEFKSNKIPMIVEALNRYMKLLDNGEIQQLRQFLANTVVTNKIEESSVSVIPKATECTCQCSNCGRKYPSGTKFCSECGSKLVSTND